MNTNFLFVVKDQKAKQAKAKDRKSLALESFCVWHLRKSLPSPTTGLD